MPSLDRSQLEPSSLEPSSLEPAWNGLLAAIADLSSLLPADASPQDRAAGHRYLTRFLAAGIRLCMESDDPDDPRFVRMAENDMSWGLDNPDCNYSWARIKPGATYRIHGRIGSARHCEFQATTGHFGDGSQSWQLISSLNRDSLELGLDGEVDVIISPAPRPPIAKNWMRNDDGASFLLLRQYFSDWEHEEPAKLSIHRVDGPSPPPPPTPSAVGAHLDQLQQWLRAGLHAWDRFHRGLQGLPANSLIWSRPQSDTAGLQGQAYGMGPWRCGPDEAIVIEFAAPKARYWSVQLANRYWESLEFASRQSSLNDNQAVVDADGRFRGVISAIDPGVANWIDTEGYDHGTIGVRFLLAEDEPEVTMTLMPIAQVADVLPATTARVSSEDRRQQLARRKHAVALRYGY